MKANEQPRETVELSPEQLQMVREAEESFKRGEGLTIAQVREMADKRTLSWLKKNQSA